MELLIPERCVTKIVLAMRVGAGAGSPVHRNRASHGLAIHAGGRFVYRFLGGPSVPVSANELVYLPKGSDYDVETVEPGDCWAINFELDADFSGTPQKWQVADLPEIWDRFQTAVAFWKKRGPFSEWKIKELLYGILYALAQLSQAPLEKRFLRIAPAVSYLESHYTDPSLSVTSLANLCDVSDTYFRRIFTEQFQVSPLQYIINKRLKLAEELLASAMYRVSDVQSLCGYNDAVGFSNAFRKRVGISPRQYMKNHSRSGTDGR